MSSPNSPTATIELPAPGPNDILGLKTYKKSLVVYDPHGGTATKGYLDELKKLGGKFNRFLREDPTQDDSPRFTGFIFPPKKLDEIRELVDRVNAGQIEAVPFVPKARDNTKQTVTWTMDRPATGDIMSLEYQEHTVLYNVLETTGGSKWIQSFIAQPQQGGDRVKVVVCDGKWCIWGIFQEHPITFIKKAATPEPKLTVPTGQPSIPVGGWQSTA